MFSDRTYQFRAMRDGIHFERKGIAKRRIYPRMVLRFFLAPSVHLEGENVDPLDHTMRDVVIRKFIHEDSAPKAILDDFSLIFVTYSH